MLLLIKYTLLYGIVLMLVALGGMFSEHSGIINIALEGIMVIGGVAGVLTLTMLPPTCLPSWWCCSPFWRRPWLAWCTACCWPLLHQPEGGPDHRRHGLNLLATAIAVVIAKYFSDSGSAKLNYSNKPSCSASAGWSSASLFRWASSC